ncbi:hypothetical protein CPC08DRAFT_626439 [Agrocybe pediades]|nr:hypothetical protein CPC08DRAFT_626439 [Agrocybe pediades]
MSPSEIATAICPGSLSGCPVAEAGSLSSLPTTYNSWMQIGFECVDLNADLRACGGCPSLDIKHDCAAIPGAHDVACISGTCVVDSCIAGYTFNSTTSTCTPN